MNFYFWLGDKAEDEAAIQEAAAFLWFVTEYSHDDSFVPPFDFWSRYIN